MEPAFGAEEHVALVELLDGQPDEVRLMVYLRYVDGLGMEENGGMTQDAAELGGHASTCTTQLYNRIARNIARSEVERMKS